MSCMKDSYLMMLVYVKGGGGQCEVLGDLITVNTEVWRQHTVVSKVSLKYVLY